VTVISQFHISNTRYDMEQLNRTRKLDSRDQKHYV